MAAPTNIGYTDVASPAQVGGSNTLANLDDPNLSFANTKLITATYTMTGNEVANDAIYIARVPSGALVDPTSTMAGNGIATTATVQVGDTDTQGGVAAYDPARYSAAVNVAAASTTPVPFTSGTTLAAPTEVTDDWPWLIATFATLGTPVAGKKLVFRIRVSALD